MIVERTKGLRGTVCSKIKRCAVGRAGLAGSFEFKLPAISVLLPQRPSVIVKVSSSLEGRYSLFLAIVARHSTGNRKETRCMHIILSFVSAFHYHLA